LITWNFFYEFDQLGPGNTTLIIAASAQLQVMYGW